MRGGARLGALAVVLLLAHLSTIGAKADAAPQLPDLMPFPPAYVLISPTYDMTAGQFYITPPHPPNVLEFPTVAINIGAYPVDILGQLRSDPLTGDPRTMDALQCVGWNGRMCSSRDNVGILYWHEAHHHWHFDDFAVYELRRLTTDGTPDLTAGGLVEQATKASFCLEDSGQYDPAASQVPFYNTCSGVLQGISPGWADVYDASVPGQQIALDNVTDGRYALVITLDPLNRLHETNDSNNQTWVTVEFSNGATQATIVPNAG